jgi:hypothetical protein
VEGWCACAAGEAPRKLFLLPGRRIGSWKEAGNSRLTSTVPSSRESRDRRACAPQPPRQYLHFCTSKASKARESRDRLACAPQPLSVLYAALRF